MRKNISFTSKGSRCSGWLYVPDAQEADQKAPAIVMAHGLAAVKEQGLPDFAERFVAAGFVTLVFDYRYFGDSEGEPRSQIFPLEMVEDYRNAITWVSDQPEVDPHRIGIWGTSYSGGNCITLNYLVFGLSLVISGIFDRVQGLSQKSGSHRHVVTYSLGIWGKTNKLPPEKVLDGITMCGHGMISAARLNSVAEDVKAGRRSAQGAARELAGQCDCGVFNPSRAAKLLAAMAK